MTSVCATLRRAVAESRELDTPLALEFAVSMALGVAWQNTESDREGAVNDFALALIGTLDPQKDDDQLVLAAIESLAPADAAGVAAALRGARPAGRVLQPWWADVIGEVELVDVMLVTDDYGDQTNHLMAFAYRRPDGELVGEHTLVLLADFNLNLVKDMFGGTGHDALDFVRVEAESTGGVTLSQRADVDLDVVATRLAHFLDVTDRTMGEPFSDDPGSVRALVGSRLRTLPPPRAELLPDPQEEWPESMRSRLVSDFLRTKAVKQLVSGVSLLEDDAPPTVDTVRHIAESLVDYAIGWNAGDPLRWSPIAVEIFLADWAPRKVSWLPEDLPMVPEVLDAWVAFAGRRRGLSRTLVDQTQEAVAEFAGDFVLAELSGPEAGSAKDIVSQMLADGVDLTDRGQMDAWVARYNASLGSPRA